MGILRRTSTLLGLDKAISYTVAQRALATINGLLLIGLLITFLSSEEQGYYYTFNSLAAAQVFFELGLSTVVVQFCGHEFSSLRWRGTQLEGDASRQQRLYAIAGLAFRWHAFISVLMIFSLFPIGLVFFHGISSPSNVAWLGPWVLLVLAIGSNLLITPLIAVLEGCGKVAEVAAVRVWQYLLGMGLTTIVLLFGGKLFGAAVMPLCGTLVAAVWLGRRYRAFFSRAWTAQADVVSWWHEIWPMQWRIAISWLSGYFVFQLFTPLLFAYQGSAVAGKMGMSLSVFFAVQTVAIAWVTTKMFHFNALIAQERFDALDHSFREAMRQSTCVLAGVAAGVVCGALWLGWKFPTIAERFLPISDLALLMVGAVINHVVSGMATYLRAHKREPFLLPSVAGGIVIGCSTWFFSKYYGPTQVIVGYIVGSAAIGLGWGYMIFARFRRRVRQPALTAGGAAHA